MRTDITIAPLPPNLPDVGNLYGKNTIITDPNFGTKIVRLTDGSISSFHSLQTADSAGVPIWNSNDTMIFARNTFSKSYLFQFNPSTLQGALLPFSTQGTVCFSASQAGWFYVLSGSVVTKNIFTLVGGVWTFSSASTVCDFANILPVGFNLKWNSEFLVSSDDTTFSCGFSEGGQNTGFRVCVYQTGHGGAGLGFRMANTQTGVITGDWGPTGAINLVTNGGNVIFPFTLHEVVMTPNPLYTDIGPHGPGANGKNVDTTIVWEIATLNLVDTNEGGHKARGYLHCYTGDAGGGQLTEIPYANPTKPYRQLIPKANLPPKFYGDRHFAFGKIVSNDQSIVWSGTGGNTPHPFTAAWEGEVFGTDVATGSVYRACHNFASNKSKEFIVGEAMCIPSQTGNFVAFCSDWGGDGPVGTLGSTSGANAGTIGVNARGDVFIVQLVADTAAPAITSANSATFTQNQFSLFSITTTGIPTPTITESGALPIGITLVDKGNGTATISGTASVTGTFTIVITAANTINPNATQNFTLTVQAPTGTAPTFLSDNNVVFTQNTPGTFTIQTSGIPTASILESGLLPSGIAFTDNGDGTGTLGGAPSTVNVYGITFTASNGVPPNAVQPFTLTVGNAPPPPPPPTPGIGPGVNQFGPYYQNVGACAINPWGIAVPGVNSPVNTNIDESVPDPPPSSQPDTNVPFIEIPDS